MFLISDLCNLLETYLPPEQVKDVYRAYIFSEKAHQGQKRLSGEPYIYHPLAVARILAEMRLDTNSIIAALLHDVIEDTSTAKDQLAKEFNEEVAELVDGVSKLTQVKFESKAESARTISAASIFPRFYVPCLCGADDHSLYSLLLCSAAKGGTR